MTRARGPSLHHAHHHPSSTAHVISDAEYRSRLERMARNCTAGTAGLFGSDLEYGFQ